MHEPQGFLRKYVFSFDHKVIGIQYLITAFVMALVGGGLAFMIRAQLAWPDAAMFKPEAYISFVTMHGTIMVFFVVSLGISAFGNFTIPLHIGARDMAYPWLNMLSYWTAVPSCLLMFLSFFMFGSVFMAFDARNRDVRERIVEVLDARPLSNLELLLGRFLGVLFMGWIPAVILVFVLWIVGLIIDEAIQLLSLIDFITLMAAAKCSVQDNRTPFLNHFLGQHHELSIGQRAGFF